MRALGGEHPGGSKPDALAATGDEHDLSCKLEIHAAILEVDAVAPRVGVAGFLGGSDASARA
jgi:hypothetical protein